MAERQRPGPQPEISLFSPGPPPEEGRPWALWAMAAVFIAVVLGLVALLSRGPAHPKPAGPPPYAAQLSFGDLKVSQAQNFVGAVVTYIDGPVSNHGDKTVTGAALEIVFANSLGQVVDDQQQPLQVLHTSGPYPEAVPLSVAPLGPHQTQQFRLIFEHISADWDRRAPAIKVTELTTK